MKRIIRVFPRRTRATPDDAFALTRPPDLFDEADEVHVSVTFTYDLAAAEKLSKAWSAVAPVKIGGPALGMAGEEFEPGRYLKTGYVITSRGCPNRCWFCSVPKREGNIRTLQIKDGWNVLDDNLLSCPENHIRSVFLMLARQKQRPTFSGGLEARRLKEWQAQELFRLHPEQLFFAYDTADDRDPLFSAGKMLLRVGFTRGSHDLRSYILIGFPGDSFDAAEERMKDTIRAGFMPFAMLYRDEDGKTSREWREFRYQWLSPGIVARKMKLLTEGRNGE